MDHRCGVNISLWETGRPIICTVRAALRRKERGANVRKFHAQR